MPETAKSALYRQISSRLETLLTDLGDEIAAMASTVAIVHQTLPYASWTGFYRVVAPQLLRIGPYQGPVGCLEIPFDRGVCGAAARHGRTQLVADVHVFEDHIVCDPRARSEIVVPVTGSDGRLAAVLDVDSHQPAAFDEEDRAGLERVAALLGPYLRASPS